jgi:hypothetical protein
MSISKKLFYLFIVILAVFALGVNFSLAGYTVKDDGVYWADMKMVDADPATWKQLRSPYSKDKDHIFFYERTIPGADPNTLKYISNWGDYIMDKNYVYCGDKRMEKADKGSFTILSDQA